MILNQLTSGLLFRVRTVEKVETRTFKELFNTIAIAHRFDHRYSGWFQNSSECIVVLDLQRSNFSRLYYLNLKVFVQGLFDTYRSSKVLVKSSMGDVFTRQPEMFNKVFDLENSMSDEKRVKGLERLFVTFVDPFTEKALSKAGIIEMHRAAELFLLDEVKKRLGI